MATSVTKPSSRSTRTQSQLQHSPNSTSKANQSFSVSSHLAMVELKQRILASLSKLSDRDTHQIAVDDLEKIIRTLPADGFPMFLNSLLHDPPTTIDPTTRQPPTTAKRECLRLLAFLCSTHPEPASAHLPKIIYHVVKRIKDSSSDTSVRDSCRDAIGSLSSLYLGTINDPTAESYSSVVTLFVKPFFEAMGEQNKGVQTGAAVCLAKLVECAVGDGGNKQRSSAVGLAFQKLLPRICKLLGGPSILSKAALLSVVSSLSQIGAITTQGMQPLLQIVRECMENSDWFTRKAAADTLSALASSSSHLVGDGAASTLTAIEACRFDKVKPVRDSMTEALGLWKKIGGKEEDNAAEGRKSLSNDGKVSGTNDHVEKSNVGGSKTTNKVLESALRKSSAGSSPIAGSISESKASEVPEKAASILKKKLPLNDKELNPEFFQKLETRISDDLPDEVVVPRKFTQLQNIPREGDRESKGGTAKGISSYENASPDFNENRESENVSYNNSHRRLTGYGKTHDLNDFARDRWAEQRVFKAKDSKIRGLESDEMADTSQKDSSARPSTSRSDIQSELSTMNNKGNWLTIQRQLLQLEKQQANLMNMLQDFMGGSHESMVTLDNRVRGLERVVEEMARDLSLSGRRSNNMMMAFEGSPGRSPSKFNGFTEYSNSKFGRAGDGRLPYTERYLASDGMASGMRGWDPHWRSDTDSRDSYVYPARNGATARRGFLGSSMDGRLLRMEHDTDQTGNKRGWDKGSGPFSFGEGPSARSVWQASKDEATLEAIRVAGEDNGTHRTAPKKAIPELDAEGLCDDNSGHERGPLWALWTRAMDSLQTGDADSAYAEILSTGDDVLLVKLMDQSGPVVDQLSNEISNEVLHAVSQFLLEQNLHDIALAWTQQLTELIMENGPEYLSVSIENKKEILLGLHDASAVELPEEWEGATAEQLMMQLASSWEINIDRLK